MPDDKHIITKEEIDELVKLAHIILLNNDKLLYFGILSSKLNLKVLDPKTYDKIYGKSSFGLTDGENILFKARDDCKLGDVVSIEIHEVLHIISDHINRKNSRNPQVWNLACDHVVNHIIKELSKINSKYVIWRDEFFYIDELDGTISAEQVYEFLTKNSNRFEITEMTIKIPNDNSNNKNNGDDKTNSDSAGNNDDKNKDENDDNGNNESEASIFKVKDKKTGKEWYVPNDTKPSNIKNPDELKEYQETAKSIWHSNTLDKGDMPGNVIQILNELFKIELPWDKVLENAILYTCQNKQLTSWTWPNECYRHLNILLPGQADDMMPNTLIAGVDTSGSISDKDLKKFIGILCSSAHHYDKLIVMMHDYDLHDYIEISEMTSPEYVFERIRQIKGRGGTSHSAIFKKIAEISEDCMLSTIMFLTDGYSDIESESTKEENKWIHDYETIWIINNYSYQLHLNDCDYKVIRINSSDDDKD